MRSLQESHEIMGSPQNHFVILSGAKDLDSSVVTLPQNESFYSFRGTYFLSFLSRQVDQSLKFGEAGQAGEFLQKYPEFPVVFEFEGKLKIGTLKGGGFF